MAVWLRGRYRNATHARELGYQRCKVGKVRVRFSAHSPGCRNLQMRYSFSRLRRIAPGYRHWIGALGRALPTAYRPERDIGLAPVHVRRRHFLFALFMALAGFRIHRLYPAAAQFSYHMYGYLRICHSRLRQLLRHRKPNTVQFSIS